MILVDTNILVHIIRTGDESVTQSLRDHQAAYCGVTKAELLQGCKTQPERLLIDFMLMEMTRLQIPDLIWDAVGENARQLRRRGFVIPFQDCVIATLAIISDVALWTRDKQFKIFQSVIPELQLFVEPPPSPDH